MARGLVGVAIQSGCNAASAARNRAQRAMETAWRLPACRALLAGIVGRAEIADFNQWPILRSNIIGQSVDFGREEVRNRIAQLTDHFMAHGMTDPTGARHQAIIALGNAVKRQALVMGLSDTFAVLGMVLVAAGIAIPSDRESQGWRGGGRRPLENI